MSKSNPIPAIFIKAKHNGYRRAGFTHTREGMGIALSALTEEQIDLLRKDPHLLVEDCTFEGNEDLARQEAERAEADRIAAEQARAGQIAAEELAAAETAAAEKAATEKAAAEKAGAPKASGKKASGKKAK